MANLLFSTNDLQLTIASVINIVIFVSSLIWWI